MEVSIEDLIKTNQKKMSTKHHNGKQFLDPLVYYSKFPIIIEQIFEKLNVKSLKSCRKVSKSWQEWIDNRNLSWITIVSIPKMLLCGEAYLHLAVKNRQSHIFGIILEDEVVKAAKQNKENMARREAMVNLKKIRITDL